MTPKPNIRHAKCSADCSAVPLAQNRTIATRTTADRLERRKALVSRAFRMRSSGLEPPRAVKPTRPSTLRVYQFRHERRVREYSLARARWRRPGCPLAAACCIRPRAALHCEHMFVAAPLPTRTGSQVPMDLTKRQQEIFDFIRKYSAKYGYPPTVRDIGKAVGLASSSTVHAHLANLEKIGLLRRDPSKPRAIELLDRAVENDVESVKGIVRPEG